ncbi:MAG TPA: hypothetical protein VHJ59_09035 [Nitrososphaera sp.]|nr:hypothetical protein [Nitrososphaera sp.]
MHYLLSECTDIPDKFLAIFLWEVVASVASKILTTLIPQPWTVYYAVHAYVCLFVMSFLETFRLPKINAVTGSEGYNIGLFD